MPASEAAPTCADGRSGASSSRSWRSMSASTRAPAHRARPSAPARRSPGRRARSPSSTAASCRRQAAQSRRRPSAVARGPARGPVLAGRHIFQKGKRPLVRRATLAARQRAGSSIRGTRRDVELNSCVARADGTLGRGACCRQKLGQHRLLLCRPECRRAPRARCGPSRPLGAHLLQQRVGRAVVERGNEDGGFAEGMGRQFVHG